MITYRIHTGDPGCHGTANLSVGDPTAKMIGATVWVHTGGRGSHVETITHVSRWHNGVYQGSTMLPVGKTWRRISKTSGDTLTYCLPDAEKIAAIRDLITGQESVPATKLARILDA